MSTLINCVQMGENILEHLECKKTLLNSEKWVWGHSRTVRKWEHILERNILEQSECGKTCQKSDNAKERPRVNTPEVCEKAGIF